MDTVRFPSEPFVTFFLALHSSLIKKNQSQNFCLDSDVHQIQLPYKQKYIY